LKLRWRLGDHVQLIQESSVYASLSCRQTIECLLLLPQNLNITRRYFRQLCYATSSRDELGCDLWAYYLADVGGYGAHRGFKEGQEFHPIVSQLNKIFAFLHQFFAYFVAQWLDLMLGDVGHPQAHYGGVCEADLDQFVVQLLLEAANSFLDG